MSRDEVPEQPARRFETMDANSDGYLDSAELEAMGSQGRGSGSDRGSPERMIRRMMSFDQNQDGKISREEAPEQLVRRFDRVDSNGDDFIEKKELEAMVRRARPPRPRRQ